MMQGFRGMIALCLAAGLWLTGALNAQAQPLQLGVIIDGSSSINNAEYDILRQQAASAIGSLKTDGSVELTVIRFGFEAFVEVQPTIVSSANIGSLSNQVLNMSRPTSPISPALLPLIGNLPQELQDDLDASGGFITGGTNFEDAILTAVGAVSGSVHFDMTGMQLFNMLTDGNPTVDNVLVQATQAASLLQAIQIVGGRRDPDVAALDARQSAITAGIDLLSFEAIGFSPTDLAFMLDELAFPGPGQLVTPPGYAFPALPPDAGAKGFVISIQGFDEVDIALRQKFLAVNAAIPEPSTLVLFGTALAGLALIRARRRR
jgi:hypothetical protein